MFTKALALVGVATLSLFCCGCGEVGSLAALVAAPKDGVDGADGVDGKDGLNGYAGPKGADGKDGPQGVKGDKGSKGDKGDDANAKHLSGSRLKTRVLVGSDGSQQFVGFWDTELDVPCSYSVMLNAKYDTRCYPTFAANLDTLPNFYSDAACKVHVVGEAQVDPAYDYVIHGGYVWTLENLVAPQDFWKVNEAGSCAKATSLASPPGEPSGLFNVVKADYSMFVKAVVGTIE